MKEDQADRVSIYFASQPVITSIYHFKEELRLSVIKGGILESKSKVCSLAGLTDQGHDEDAFI